MSKKHVSWLAALTGAVLLLILLMPGKSGKESEFSVQALVPALDARVNDVTWVRISRAGDAPSVTLMRTEGRWTVQESGSYLADWSRLRSLLMALSKARVIEQKTSNPDYFDRLGVADISEPDSTAVLLEIGEGEESTRLLLGSKAQGRDGQYVRFQGQDQALLMDRSFEFPPGNSDWLQRDVVDLAETEVVDVTLTHEDGESLHISRVSADDADFTLMNLPEGREIQSSWAVNGLAGSLAGLRLEDVQPASELDWSGATDLRLLTADGIEVRAQLLTLDEQSWLQLEAFLYPPDDSAAEPASPIDGSESDTAANEQEQAMAADRQRRVDDINQRAQGWAYSIPEYKASGINKRLEDVLKPVAAD